LVFCVIIRLLLGNNDALDLNTLDRYLPFNLSLKSKEFMLKLLKLYKKGLTTNIFLTLLVLNFGVICTIYLLILVLNNLDAAIGRHFFILKKNQLK
jgi:hypothetical protein